MRQFIVRNHRDRKKLTLMGAKVGKVQTSLTIQLTGRRVIELSDKVCAKYASAIEEYCKAGALYPMAPASEPTPAPAPEPDPLLSPEVQADEVDEDPSEDEPEGE